MDLKKEKPAVGAPAFNTNGQYTLNGSYTTAVVPQNQLEYDSAVYAALKLQAAAAGREDRPVEPFVAKLTQDEKHNQVWEMLPLTESRKAKIIDLHREGISNKEIANELEIDLSTVYRILNKAEEEGIIRSMKDKKKK